MFPTILNEAHTNNWIESLGHGMAWVGRDQKNHFISATLPGEGHLPLFQVPQSPIQPGVEHSQGWGIHSFSRQHVPVFHTVIQRSVQKLDPFSQVMENFWNSAELLGVDFSTTALPERGPTWWLQSQLCYYCARYCYLFSPDV